MSESEFCWKKDRHPLYLWVINTRHQLLHQSTDTSPELPNYPERRAIARAGCYYAFSKGL